MLRCRWSSRACRSRSPCTFWTLGPSGLCFASFPSASRTSPSVSPSSRWRRCPRTDSSPSSIQWESFTPPVRYLPFPIFSPLLKPESLRLRARVKKGLRCRRKLSSRSRKDSGSSLRQARIELYGWNLEIRKKNCKKVMESFVFESVSSGQIEFSWSIASEFWNFRARAPTRIELVEQIVPESSWELCWKMLERIDTPTFNRTNKRVDKNIGNVQRLFTFVPIAIDLRFRSTRIKKEYFAVNLEEFRQ